MAIIDWLRESLKRNKIFFEIFSMIVLGVMAVLVSVAALQVSHFQAKLTDAQVSPHIRVASENVFDPTVSKYNDEVFRVYNDGFALGQFDANVKSLIQVTNRSLNKQRSVLIPTVYVVISYQTDNSTGLLRTFLQKDNYFHMRRIENEVREASDIKKDIYYDVRLINLLSVSYVDSLGRANRKYFLVGSAPGGLEVSTEEGAQLTAAYEKGLGPPLYGQSIEKMEGKALIRQLAANQQ